MSKRKKRRLSLLQIPIAYPPEALPEHFHTWLRCKHLYKEHVVILKANGYYFTVAEDALLIHQLTGSFLDTSGEWPICYFRTEDLYSVFEAFNSAGQFLAICDPPEEPRAHIFN